VNAIYAFEPKNAPENTAVLREGVESVVLLLSPFVPHVTEELWEAIGHRGGVEAAGWPVWDETATVDEELLIVVQVNGKLRGKVTVPAGATEELVKQAAFADERVQSWLEGKQIRKAIYVPGKLLNIVVG
jgi:leucyl-tRNA synthetase